MPDNSITELPQPDERDKFHDLVMLIASGFSPARLIDKMVPSPIEKRMKDWLEDLANRFAKLENQVESFRVEELLNNEVFISTLLQATQIAIRKHQKEVRRALRNAVLNSALPAAPDETRQEMFLQWLNELTVWHIKILEVFQEPNVPELNLTKGDWVQNINTAKLGDLIEAKYPGLKGQFPMYILIVNDLNSRGLISNLFPAKDVMTRIAHRPELTKTAKEFLKFIESPIEEVETS